MKKQKHKLLVSNMDERDGGDSQFCRGTYPVFAMCSEFDFTFLHGGFCKR